MTYSTYHHPWVIQPHHKSVTIIEDIGTDDGPLIASVEHCSPENIALLCAAKQLRAALERLTELADPLGMWEDAMKQAMDALAAARGPAPTLN